MLKTIAQKSLIALAALWLLITSAHAAVMVYGSFTDYHSVFTVDGTSCLVVIKGGKSAVGCVPKLEETN